MSFDYIAKPVMIEAFQYDDTGKTQMFPNWLFPAFTDGTLHKIGEQLKCNTKQGPVNVYSTDYLIRLADGEIYPCSEEVFKSKYEKCPEIG